MRDMLAEVLRGSKWEPGDYGDSVVCPCGEEIELDGECSECGPSPLLAMGVI